MDMPPTRKPPRSAWSQELREHARLRFNHTLREIAAERPDDLEILELSRHLETLGTDGPPARPDGVHFSRKGARELARSWLGPSVLRALDREAKRASYAP